MLSWIFAEPPITGASELHSLNAQPIGNEGGNSLSPGLLVTTTPHDRETSPQRRSKEPRWPEEGQHEPYNPPDLKLVLTDTAPKLATAISAPVEPYMARRLRDAAAAAASRSKSLNSEHNSAVNHDVSIGSGSSKGDRQQPGKGSPSPPAFAGAIWSQNATLSKEQAEAMSQFLVATSRPVAHGTPVKRGGVMAMLSGKLTFAREESPPIVSSETAAATLSRGIRENNLPSLAAMEREAITLKPLPQPQWQPERKRRELHPPPSMTVKLTGPRRAVFNNLHAPRAPPIDTTKTAPKTAPGPYSSSRLRELAINPPPVVPPKDDTGIPVIPHQDAADHDLHLSISPEHMDSAVDLTEPDIQALARRRRWTMSIGEEMANEPERSSAIPDANARVIRLPYLHRDHTSRFLSIKKVATTEAAAGGMGRRSRSTSNVPELRYTLGEFLGTSFHGHNGTAHQTLSWRETHPEPVTPLIGPTRDVPPPSSPLLAAVTLPPSVVNSDPVYFLPPSDRPPNPDVPLNTSVWTPFYDLYDRGHHVQVDVTKETGTTIFTVASPHSAAITVAPSARESTAVPGDTEYYSRSWVPQGGVLELFVNKNFSPQWRRRPVPQLRAVIALLHVVSAGLAIGVSSSPNLHGGGVQTLALGAWVLMAISVVRWAWTTEGRGAKVIRLICGCLVDFIAGGLAVGFGVSAAVDGGTAAGCASAFAGLLWWAIVISVLSWHHGRVGNADSG